MMHSVAEVMKGRPTMNDVAATAGVALKTVSRVVNDEPGVNAATAERVRRAIDRLGYRRNEGARVLRRGRAFASRNDSGFIRCRAV